jgi:hypothetical protein
MVVQFGHMVPRPGEVGNRMSLWSALRTGPSVLLLADSQETHGRTRRKKVSKLKLYRSADGRSINVAYVAAGNSGPFVDFLGDKIGRWTRRTQATLPTDIERELRAIVRRHYEGKSTTASGKQRQIQGVVCVASKGQGQTLLYEFTFGNLTLNTRPNAAILRGIDYQDMTPLLDRFYRRNASRGMTGVLGVYVMWKVKQVSNWVGLSTAAIDCDPRGFSRIDERLIQILERGIEDLFRLRLPPRSLLAAANLAAPDTTVKRIVGTKWERVSHVREVMLREVSQHKRQEHQDWHARLRAQLVPEVQ